MAGSVLHSPVVCRSLVLSAIHAIAIDLIKVEKYKSRNFLGNAVDFSLLLHVKSGRQSLSQAVQAIYHRCIVFYC